MRWLLLIPCLLSPMAMAKNPTPPVTPDTTQSVDEGPYRPFRMTTGIQVPVISSNAYFGPSIGVELRVNRHVPLYVGFETGAYFHIEDSSSNNYNSSSYYIPLLLTTTYRFDLGGSIHPIIGLQAGPALMYSASFSTFTYGYSRSQQTTRFQAMLRTGVEFDISARTHLSIEPRIGVIGGYFIVAPTIGVSFFGM